MEKYILGEISSSGGATLYKNPSDQTVISVIPPLRSKSSRASKIMCPKTGRNSFNTSMVIFLELEYCSVSLDKTPSAIFEIVLISTKSHISRLWKTVIPIFQFSINITLKSDIYFKESDFGNWFLHLKKNLGSSRRRDTLTFPIFDI